MMDLSTLEGLEVTGSIGHHNMIREVVFLTLTVIMAILYWIYMYSYCKHHEEVGEVSEDFELFSLAKQQHGAMKIIFPLVTFILITKFLTFVVFKASILITISSISIAIPVVVVTVFIKVEISLLIVIAFCHVFKKPVTNVFMKKVKKVLLWIFWILQLIPAVLAVIMAISGDFYVVIGVFAILAMEIIAELVITNGLLLIVTLCYLAMIFSCSDSDDQRHLDRSEVFQTFLIVVVKIIYFIYFFLSSTMWLDKLFMADFVNMDYILLPMSILVAYFVYSKPGKVTDLKV